jgi:hypothetical protein
MKNRSSSDTLEARRVGRTAFLFGGAWTIGLVALWLVQTRCFGNRMVFVLPLFSLLVLTWTVLGAYQWATGNGGLRAQQSRLSTRARVAVQVIAFVLLSAIFGWAGRGW